MWIRTIDDDDAQGPLAEMYRRYADPGTGRIDHVLKVHALDPRTLEDHARMYVTLMHGPSGLTRTEREMVAVVVSSLNACHY